MEVLEPAIEEPSSTLVPLNEAPVTASVSSWPSEASVVLMSPSAAPGLVASVSADWIWLIVVMIDWIAVLPVSSTAWLCESAELDAVTMPLSALSWVAIDQ